MCLWTCCVCLSVRESKRETVCMCRSKVSSVVKKLGGSIELEPGS